MVWTACGPRLDARVVASHPPALKSRTRPKIIEASASTPPAWIGGASNDDQVSFVGRGEASSKTDALSRAVAELSEIVGRYGGVRVSNTMSATSKHEDIEGQTTETQSVRRDVRATGESVESVPITDTYTEARIGADGRTTHRAFVLARLDKTTLARLDEDKRLARARGARQLVRFDLDGDHDLARWVRDELLRTLAANVQLMVTDSAAHPDVIVRLTIADEGRALYAIIDPTTEQVVGPVEVSTPGGNQFELEAALAAALQLELQLHDRSRASR